MPNITFVSPSLGLLFSSPVEFMITVTLGTIGYPFERALVWIEQLLETKVIDEPVFVQYGSSNIESIARHPLVTAMPTVPRPSLERWVDQSRLVIAHAGQGTTRMLIEREAHFILLPRLAQHGEHVDNHQLAFAQSTQSLGVLHGLSLTALRSAVLNPPPLVETDFFDGPKLSTHLLQKYPASQSRRVKLLQSVQ